MIPQARSAGGALAFAALVLAFAASAQTAAWDPHPGTTGILPWLFAIFAAVAIAGVFLTVLWLVRRPSRAPGQAPPGSARQRV
jgi:hypothetical protein